ncbi:Glu-tRNA(Gln) amidotransferase subunit GatD, partial [Candidatus Falkowbacteria bacterium]|nr:Glu-tRNA(Gln) amidotransferase subunit GatD [Candidatus Falkowbacteria bacterium]
MAASGDRVKVISKKRSEEGILMPSFGKNSILLKLDSGYNVGFEKKEVTKITVIAKGTEKKKLAQKLKKNPHLPTIAILHTGGTIASKVDYRTGGVATEFSPEELLSLFPELKGLADIESELIAQMWSDDLRFAHFSLIAAAIERHLKKGVRGIIIGMGTDNLAVASAALSFIVEKSSVPIIFVGAQRSSDRGSSDAAMNLICAVEFAVKADFGGVAICMHEKAGDTSCAILPAAKTYKLHSSRRDAFRAINSTALARVDYTTRKITFLQKEYPQRADKLVLKPKMEEKVGLLKIHINMFPEQFSFFKGYQGLVIEGTGLGHTPGQV